ncbi:MAG: aldo/keto reductase [Myxococcaceae bacterium]|nr:aldo/keto reductase [Myxococcaceae bacterium]
MNYRRLGRAGLKVSELSLGSWVTFGGQVGDGATEACMTAAYEAGVNFFDGAEVYAKGQAELAMGRVLKKQGWRREGLVLSTKLFWGGDGPNDVGLSHKHVIEGFHAALRRWQVDYLDLCFCHRPDPNTPIEETVRAMDVLVRQGTLFYWGTSEWSAADVETAFAVAKANHLTPPTMEQPQYNMLVRDRLEKEYAPLFEKHGYGTTIWSPLASGVLSGKYDAGVPPESRLALSTYDWLKEKLLAPATLATSKALAPLAQALGCTRAQLAIAWCLKNPNVSTVITGASRAEQVAENVKALSIVPRLTPEVMARIEGVLQGTSR